LSKHSTPNPPPAVYQPTVSLERFSLSQRRPSPPPLVCQQTVSPERLLVSASKDLSMASVVVLDVKNATASGRRNSVECNNNQKLLRMSAAVGLAFLGGGALLSHVVTLALVDNITQAGEPLSSATNSMEFNLPTGVTWPRASMDQIRDQGQIPGQNQGQIQRQNQGQIQGQNQGQVQGQNQGRAEKRRADLSLMYAELADKETSLDNLKTECEIEDSIDMLIANDETVQMCTTLEREISKLRSDIAALITIVETPELKAEMKELAEENQLLTVQNADLQLQIPELKAEIQKLAQTHADLKFNNMRHMENLMAWAKADAGQPSASATHSANVNLPAGAPPLRGPMDQIFDEGQIQDRNQDQTQIRSGELGLLYSKLEQKESDLEDLQIDCGKWDSIHRLVENPSNDDTRKILGAEISELRSQIAALIAMVETPQLQVEMKGLEEENHLLKVTQTELQVQIPELKARIKQWTQSINDLNLNNMKLMENLMVWAKSQKRQ